MRFNHKILAITASILITLGINNTKAANPFFQPGAQPVLSINGIETDHAAGHTFSYHEIDNMNLRN